VGFSTNDQNKGRGQCPLLVRIVVILLAGAPPQIVSSRNNGRQDPHFLRGLGLLHTLAAGMV